MKFDLKFLEPDQMDILFDNAYCVEDWILELELNELRHKLIQHKRSEDWTFNDCLLVKTQMTGIYRFMRSMGFIDWNGYNEAVRELNNSIQKICDELGLDDLCF